MKLHFIDRSNVKDNSFSIKHNNYPYFLRVWHYHPELELVYINKSEGTKFVGDSIERFEKGEVVLIGANLPHMWLNDKQYFDEPSNLMAEAYTVHFKKDFLGSEFFNANELRHIKDLIDVAQRGMKFVGVGDEIKKMLKELSKKEPFNRLMYLLRILDHLALCKEYTLLASRGYLATFRKFDTRGMGKTYQYIFNNFNKPISLTDVAEVASMNPSAFSRLFKKVNRKTFKEYLNEIRVGYARKLITENEYNITRICYESGYNNISNFNRQFKKITGKSPTEYQKQYREV